MSGLKAAAASLALVLTVSAASAETELDKTLSSGGKQLTSGQLAELLIGHIVTARSGDKTFRFFYDPDNVITGELTNGGWKGSGAFAITDTDQVCISMAADMGRYRCLTVVRHGDVIRKFDASGKMTFELLGFEPSTGL